MPYINAMKQKTSIINRIMETVIINSKKIKTNIINKYQTLRLFGFATGQPHEIYFIWIVSPLRLAMTRETI
jgi:hypothetical protein